MPAVLRAAVISPLRTDDWTGTQWGRQSAAARVVIALGMLAATEPMRATGTQAPPVVLKVASNDPSLPPNAAFAGPARAANPLWLVALGDLPVTRQRPIFTASRRPPAPPAIAVVPAPPPPPPPPAPVVALPERPSLVLIGTIIGPSVQTGIFREEASDRIVKLATGAGRDGWTLRSVSRSDARFEMAERTAVLPLRAAAQPMPQGKSVAARPSSRREWYDN